MDSIRVNAPFAASAVSGHLDTRTAATEIADRLFDGFVSTAGACDFALLFGSFHHRSAFDEAANLVRRTVDPRVMLGVTAEAVLGEDREFEGVAGMSALALRLPGARVLPWQATPDDPLPLNDAGALRQRVGADEHTRAVIMFGDPFTTPITRLLPAVSRCVPGRPTPIIGGMASGASQPGVNVMVVDGDARHAGVVGATISGGTVDFECLISQGCRPIGQPLVVTRCERNLILELGGRKALEVLQEVAERLSDAERRLLSRGLLLGAVINEYKPRFGRGDFLVKSLMGFDQKRGGIAAGEMMRPGRTVQFHVRDAATAEEDLQLLLDGQAMHGRAPLGAMLVTCNGRGQRLFATPNHDLEIVRSRLGEAPIAGFFAAGEIGPTGAQSHLHGQTACLTVLRAAT